jgi:hypothetical protein
MEVDSPENGDDVLCPDEERDLGPTRKRAKHQKGIVRLNLSGKVVRVNNKLTFKEAYRCRRGMASI